VRMTDKTHMLGVWMLFDHGVKDWFCQIAQHGPHTPWVMEYRFRIYLDDKIHGSEDEKRFFSLQFKEDTAKAVMVDVARKLSETLKGAGFGTEDWEILIDSRSPDVIFTRMSTCPHLHAARLETPEDAEAAGYTEIAEEWRRTGVCPLTKPDGD